MGKYLVLWETDQSEIPVDPKQRGTAWKALIGMVKQGLETGTAKDWGAFVGESSGYVVHEGSEVEVGLALQQYVPFATFKVHPIASVSQVEEIIQGLLQ